MANVQTNRITRDKLAKIFKNQEAIKLIENLVQDVSTALPVSIDTNTGAAAAAQATANTALATANAALALGGGGGGSLVVFQAEDTPEPEIFFLPTAPASGGASSLTSATVTVPYGSTDYVATVADALVTGSSKVLIAPGHHAQTDANSPADISFNVESVSAGSFTLMISSRSGTIGGPFKFTYMLG